MTNPFHVGFLLYPNLTQLDLTGPAQFLSRAPGAKAHYIWKSLAPVPSDAGLSLMPTTTFKDCPSVYGILTGDVDCQAGTELASGASCVFSITEFVSGDFSGESHHNVFTGKATDNDGNEDTATDDETVTYTDVKPVVTLEKNVDIAIAPRTRRRLHFQIDHHQQVH